ncbi:SRPBCC family protein [Pontibacter saemangeumensis]|uniref:SRPBCC family protein n=1 Tax=Pontibacter saemangeumensis TaxID=1084525 RepID=A0ABP8LK17_9BACT
MVDILTETVIDRPLAEVAAYAANPDNAPEWYENIRAAVWKTPKPLQVGSQVAFTAHFLGRQLAYTYRIREYIPGQRLVMGTEEGPFPMETTYTWEAINQQQTRMMLRNAGEPAGFSKLFAPLMATMMRKANTKDLKRIKQILEKEPLK